MMLKMGPTELMRAGRGDARFTDQPCGVTEDLFRATSGLGLCSAEVATRVGHCGNNFFS
jgi:hypothetical protein